MQEFECGDFVVVGENNLVGIVRDGRKCVHKINEVEIWFGDLGEGGLPVTYYVAENLLLNIKGARSLLPFFKRNLDRRKDVS